LEIKQMSEWTIYNNTSAWGLLSDGQRAAEQFERAVRSAALEEPDIVECYETTSTGGVAHGFRYKLEDGTQGPFSQTRDQALAYWQAMMDGEG
jgi:hypothetical protein